LADNEGDLALSELPLGQLVRVGLARLRHHHERGILGELESKCAKNPSSLILGQERGRDAVDALGETSPAFLL